MRNKAFTLIELLVVIAIIAILAAILFPVFSQAKEAAKKTSDLSNVKQTSMGVYMYCTDTDDVYPTAFGTDSTGTWRWNFNHYFPADKVIGAGGDGNYPIRSQISRYSWANITQPYIKSQDMLAGPGMPEVIVAAGLADFGGNANPKGVSYTYNGILAGSASTIVASPSALPMIWGGRGKAKVMGAALANPALRCDQPNLPCTYIPSAAGCTSTINGQVSAMFTLAGPVWTYSRGANFGAADGSAKYRVLGAQLSPNNTDYNKDPYTGYSATGFPGFYWWDGCHAWLFRPDFQNNL